MGLLAAIAIQQTCHTHSATNCVEKDDCIFLTSHMLARRKIIQIKHHIERANGYLCAALYISIYKMFGPIQMHASASQPTYARTHRHRHLIDICH